MDVRTSASSWALNEAMPSPKSGDCFLCSASSPHALSPCFVFPLPYFKPFRKGVGTQTEPTTQAQCSALHYCHNLELGSLLGRPRRSWVVPAHRRLYEKHSPPKQQAPKAPSTFADKKPTSTLQMEQSG